MTEPPLNLDHGFTVSVYFPPGSDPHWVSGFLDRAAEDAYSMPSDTLDAFVVGHACDMLGIDEERAGADRYAAKVNAPLRPETITAIAERIKSGDFPVRKVAMRGSHPARPGRATMAADRCPRCGGDNTEAWVLCGKCETAGEQP